MNLQEANKVRDSIRELRLMVDQLENRIANLEQKPDLLPIVAPMFHVEQLKRKRGRPRKNV